MNAFHRGHAVTALEELSLIIAIHCVLTTGWPDHDAFSHWQGELDGFCKTLRRLNKGKKGRNNFTESMIAEELTACLTDHDDMTTIEEYIAAKSFDMSQIDWERARQMAGQFAIKVMA